MTITPFDIYLISVVNGISVTMFILMLVGILLCVMGAISADIKCSEEGITSAKKLCKRGAIIFFSSLFFFSAIPNSKTVAAMFLIPAIVNNEHLQNSAGNALEMLEELTKKWLKDITKQKGEREVEATL